MKIGICDDENIFRKIIKEYCEIILSDMKLQYEVDTFSNGEELLSSGELPDILFLDIEMPQENGFQIAEKIREQKKDTYIIFVTGFEDMMKQAFKVRAYRFIVKPVNKKEFEEALKTAVYDILNNRSILIQSDKSVVRLSCRDILYIESLGAGCAVHVKERYYLTRDTLKYFTEKLYYPDFFQVSRTHIISLRHVVKLDQTYVYLDTDDKIPVSRRMRKELKKILLEVE